MTEPSRIEFIHIKGFRFLADVKLDSIPNPMVLLGINGAGKSNVLRFFEMLKSIFTPKLLQFVVRHGGADDQLFGGDRVTPRKPAGRRSPWTGRDAGWTMCSLSACGAP